MLMTFPLGRVAQSIICFLMPSGIVRVLGAYSGAGGTPNCSLPGENPAMTRSFRLGGFNKLCPELIFWPKMVAVTSARRKIEGRVSRPTTPSTSSCCRFWNARTAWSVSEAENPVYSDWGCDAFT